METKRFNNDVASRSNALVMVMCLLLGTMGQGVQQPAELAAMEGASVQVNCTYQTPGFNGLFWYKQLDGGAPVFLSYNVLDGLDTRGRFPSFLSRSDTYSYLLLRELQHTDSASYLCAVIDTSTLRPLQLHQNSEGSRGSGKLRFLSRYLL